MGVTYLHRLARIGWIPRLKYTVCETGTRSLLLSDPKLVNINMADADSQPAGIDWCETLFSEPLTKRSGSLLGDVSYSVLITSDFTSNGKVLAHWPGRLQ